MRTWCHRNADPLTCRTHACGLVSVAGPAASSAGPAGSTAKEKIRRRKLCMFSALILQKLRKSAGRYERARGRGSWMLVLMPP